MRWCKTISLVQSPREIRLVQPPAPENVMAEAAAARQSEQVAYERGLADGEKRLGEQLVRQRAELTELQKGVLASLRGAVTQVIQQSEAGLIELALEVARKLVSGLPISAEMVEAAVRSALAQTEESVEIQVSLHPEDLALLQRCNSPVLLPEPGKEGIRFQATAEITRGGCLVQTRFGVIDARQETKLDLVRQALAS